MLKVYIENTTEKENKEKKRGEHSEKENLSSLATSVFFHEKNFLLRVCFV